VEGYFGEEDTKGRRTTFALRDLSQRSEFNGLTFSQLSPKVQRGFKQSTLRAIHVRQISPTNRGDSAFHIFERLNTVGTLLKPNEIRNAVYRGNIVEELATLNSNEHWQNILGLKKPDRNQKDIELVLRVFALCDCWEQYESPMIQYLNDTQRENSNFNDSRATKFKQKFPKITKLVSTHLEKPFRPKRVINSAMLEAVMVALMEMPILNEAQFKQNYAQLLGSEPFLDTVNRSTTNTATLRRRVSLAKEILHGG
jgi:hypothetical protein